MPNDKKTEIKRLQLELNKLQRDLFSKEIPVLIMMDGYSSAGIGDLLSDMILEMDPRHFKVHVFERETETDKRMPLMWRFWQKLPQKGKMAIYDKSFYSHILYDYKLNEDDLSERVSLFRETEKMLVDDAYLLIKIFVNISEDEQKKRLEKLRKNKATRFRATPEDFRQNSKFKKIKKQVKSVIEMSDFDFSPWHVVDSDDMQAASLDILKIVSDEIKTCLSAAGEASKEVYPDYNGDFNIGALSLDVPSLEEEQYKKQLHELQKKAKKLAYAMYTEKIPSVLVFEGWDAAGKGGAIKRLLKRVDPRGYEVSPISAPSAYDKSLHYLSRFYRHLPKTGHIALFDRSWYGRLMVERIEGFATESEWKRAYEEINSFEKSLEQWGALVIKFFINIDKDTQLERFKAREENPLKKYKITDEDWRNREKWDEYEKSISEMIDKTHKPYAPWIVVEGNDKRYARIKVLKTFVDMAEKALKKKGK